MVSEDVLRGSASWLLAVLAGDIPPDDVEAGFVPRLSEGRDIRTALARRFARFRDYRPELASFECVAPTRARAVVHSGGEEWEFTIAVEAAAPHRIAVFQPHLVPADAVPWTDVAGRLRDLDHRSSSLPAAIASRVRTRLLDAVTDEHIAGLCCGVVLDGAVVHREFLGAADVRSLIPLGEASVFRVGSVTKLVTALAVLDLVDIGALDLSAELSRYVPSSPGGFDATVSELLLNRSGLPKDLLRQRGTSVLPGTLADAVIRLKPAWPAGERAEYSSLGYELLGLLVEHVAAESFANYCARRILPRFGMTGVQLPRPDAIAPSTVTGTEVVVGKVAAVVEDVESYRFASGMTADLPSLLALANAVGRADDPLIRALMMLTTPAGGGARFVPGAALLDRPGGTIVWRGGSTRGFTAELMAAGDGSAAVVLLAAATPAPGLRAVADELVSGMRAGGSWAS
ncbi:serine hydrolase domain-containing protein [Actinoallomurus acanthiterrae]